MIEWVKSFMAAWGLLLYLIPMTFCLVGYTVRTWTNVRRERQRRTRDPDGHYPQETIGTLVGRLFVSVLPVANIWAMTFDLCGDVLAWLERVFNQPLVPRRSR